MSVSSPNSVAGAQISVTKSALISKEPLFQTQCSETAFGPEYICIYIAFFGLFMTSHKESRATNYETWEAQKIDSVAVRWGPVFGSAPFHGKWHLTLQKITFPSFPLFRSTARIFFSCCFWFFFPKVVDTNFRRPSSVMLQRLPKH